MDAHDGDSNTPDEVDDGGRRPAEPATAATEPAEAAAEPTEAAAEHRGAADPADAPGHPAPALPHARPAADAPVPPTPVPPAHPEAAESWGRVASLPLAHRIGAAVALAVVGVVTCVHLGMVFLHVAPSNTLTKQHGEALEDWIYPEFEQNWKLFAPNPLQQNIAVQVRAQVRTSDGGTRVTGWYNLSAQDGRAIDGNLLPSHTQQNELRRAWDFFTATHDNDNRPIALRGALSEQYLRRIVVLRLGRDDAAGAGGVVERVQIRSSTTNVEPPKWSAEKVPDTPTYRELSWWPVPASEADGSIR